MVNSTNPFYSTEQKVNSITNLGRPEVPKFTRPDRFHVVSKLFAGNFEAVDKQMNKVDVFCYC